MIVLDAGSLPDKADSTPIANDDPQAEMTLSVPLRNYAGKTVLFEAVPMGRRRQRVRGECESGAGRRGTGATPAITMSVVGKRAVEDNAAVPARLNETHRASRVLMLVNDAPDGADSAIRITLNRAEWLTLTLPDGEVPVEATALEIEGGGGSRGGSDDQAGYYGCVPAEVGTFPGWIWR